MTDTVSKGYVYKEDFDLYDGVNLTGNRKTSTGGSQSLNRMDWAGIDVYQIYGDKYGKTGAAIAAAAGAVGTDTRVLFLNDGNWELSANVSLGSNIFLRVSQGTRFTRAASETITLHSPDNLKVSARQQLTAVDMIDFQYGGIVYPQWWGALGDGSNDDSTAIQYAINSLTCSTVLGGEVRFRTGQYSLGSTGITILTDGVKLRAESGRFVGSAAFGVEFLYTGSGAAVTFGVSGTINYRCGFDKIQIRATGGATSSGTAVGLKLINQHYFKSDEAAIKDFAAGTGLLFEPAGALMFGATSQFRAIMIHVCFYGVHSKGTDIFTKDNHTIFYGGAIIGDVTAGSIGVWLPQYSDGYIFYGTDIESFDYGFYIDGISHRSIGARTEFCDTAAVYLAANSQKCVFLEHQFAGAGTQWVDNGLLNVRFNHGDYFGKLAVTPYTDGTEVLHLRDSSQTSLLNLDTTPADPKIMLGNSCSFTVYSDNYITHVFRVVGSTGAVQIGGESAQGIVRHLSGAAAYDPPSIAAGGTDTTTVTVTGATTGGNVPVVCVGINVSLQGMMLTGYVSAADTVTVVFYNPTAGAIDLPLIYLRADVWEH